ncbi:TPA: hypothetical protein MYQ17_004752 [Citrobacter amalonaticus]|nr:hypothetical protein [Citrobacter amalonaticus]
MRNTRPAAPRRAGGEYQREGKRMSEKNVTISAAIPANVKAEAAAVAAAHGMSLAALLRELLARVAARDAETLAWLDEARR